MSRVYEKNDFESVCKTIENEIINQGKCMSIDTLLNIYRENVDKNSWWDYIYFIWIPNSRGCNK